MILRKFPIFQKDFRILFVQMLGALGIQFLLMFLIPLLSSLIKEWFAAETLPVTWGMSEWFPVMQIFITGLVALSAAALWSVGEREENNEAFLKRLPIPFLQAQLEKMFAHVLVLTILVVCQYLWVIVSAELWRNLWEDDYMRLYYLLYLIGFYTAMIYFVIGLPLSVLCKQSIAVIIFGTALTIVIIFLFDAGVKFTDYLDVIIVAAVVIAFVIYSLRRSAIHRNYGDTQCKHYTFLNLQNKQMRLPMLINGIGFVFILSGVQIFDVTTKMYFSAFALLLCGMTGVLTYSNHEKEGTNCIVYHHSVSRSKFYLTKYFHGLLVALPMIVVFCYAMMFLVRLANLQPAFLDDFQIYKLDSFRVGVMAFMVGVLFYTCGVLMTHAIRNSFYAVIESIFAASAAIVSVMYLQYHMFSYARLSLPHGFNAYRLPLICWPLLFMIIAFAFAGWKAATDRENLTSTTWRRQLYILRLYSFAMAVVVILVTTGWSDLFYLI